MTRMFFHLMFCGFLFLFSGCSLFESEDKVSADNIDGKKAELDGGSDNFSDLEDLPLDDEGDKNSTTASSTDKNSKDSFSDIEDFNEEQLGSELGKENIAKSDKPATDNFSDLDKDLDLETADVNQLSPPPTQESLSIEPQPSVSVVASDNKITNLEYKSFESGGTVIITSEKPVQYQVKEEPGFNQVIVEVADVQLPARLKRPYIAKDFGQPVATINAYQDVGATTARFVIQYKSPMKPAIEQKQNSLFVSSSGGASSMMSVTQIDRQDSTPVNKNVTIQMDNVELKEVVQLLADEGGVNVLADEKGMDKKISVRLRDVPWEEALMSILKAHGLGYVKKGNILRIAEQKTLTEEAEQYLKQLRSQVGSVRAVRGRAIRFFPISYADVTEVQKNIQPFLTEGAKASADKNSNAVIVSEFENQMERVEKIIKAMDVAPLQLVIEGKIVEASEDFNKEIGLKWSSTTSFTGSQNGSATSALTPPNGLTKEGFATTITAGTFDVLGDLNAVLHLFEAEQKVKVLSSPKIMALNKQKATFEQVTEYPIVQVTTTNTSVQQAPTFQKFNISLEVTPQVTFSGDTILDVTVNRDIPGASENGARRNNKRKASTKVMVHDGQTAVIGGIYSMDENQRDAGIPWLKDIPILGYLFKSKTRGYSKNELLIFLTPRIVNPESLRQAMTISSEKKTSLEDALDPSEFDSMENQKPQDEVKSL